MTNDDPKRAQQARQLLRPYQSGQIFLETAVFYEAAFVLSNNKSYAMPRTTAARLLRNILNTGKFTCDEVLLLTTLELYETTRLDFVDCLVAAQVQLKRAKTLLTLDQPLLKKLKSRLRLMKQ